MNMGGRSELADAFIDGRAKSFFFNLIEKIKP